MKLNGSPQRNERKTGRQNDRRDNVAGKVVKVTKGRMVDLVQGVSDDVHAEFVRIAKERSQSILGQNTATVGARVDMDWLVDGKAGRSLEAVKEGGRIAFFYNPIQAVVNDAMRMALRWAPVGDTPDSPKYKNSFIILQDVIRGQDTVSMEVPWPGRVDGIYVEILNTQPYAGSLEPHTRARRGPRVSRQAPNGIMELVAANMKAKWGSVMRINLVSKQWPSVIQGKNPHYHLPTLTLSPNWRGKMTI
ncbi:MAG: hypothetical protein WBM35_15215 [Candidatus Electrothrix sp.]